MHAQCEQKKLYDGSYNKITDIWYFKKFCFWRNLEEMLNWLKSARWIELENSHMKSHVRWLYAKMIVDTTNWTKSRKDKFIKLQNNNSLKVKCECQLIVRLKVIKSIEELFCFLSSYIKYQSSIFYSPRLFLLTL